MVWCRRTSAVPMEKCMMIEACVFSIVLHTLRKVHTAKHRTTLQTRAPYFKMVFSTTCGTLVKKVGPKSPFAGFWRSENGLSVLFEGRRDHFWTSETCCNCALFHKRTLSPVWPKTSCPSCQKRCHRRNLGLKRSPTANPETILGTHTHNKQSNAKQTSAQHHTSNPTYTVSCGIKPWTTGIEHPFQKFHENVGVSTNLCCVPTNA